MVFLNHIIFLSAACGATYGDTLIAKTLPCFEDTCSCALRNVSDLVGISMPNNGCRAKIMGTFSLSWEFSGTASEGEQQ